MNHLDCLLTERLAGPNFSHSDSEGLSWGPATILLIHSQVFTAHTGDGPDSVLGTGDIIMNACWIQSTIEGNWGTQLFKEYLSDEWLRSITRVLKLGLNLYFATD